MGVNSYTAAALRSSVNIIWKFYVEVSPIEVEWQTFCGLCQPLLRIPELYIIMYKTYWQNAYHISHSSPLWALVCKLRPDVSKNLSDWQKAEGYSSWIQKLWAFGSDLFFWQGTGFSLYWSKWNVSIEPSTVRQPNLSLQTQRGKWPYVMSYCDVVCHLEN